MDALRRLQEWPPRAVAAIGGVSKGFSSWVTVHQTALKRIAAVVTALAVAVGLYGGLVTLGILPKPFGDGGITREAIRQEVAPALQEQLSQYLADLGTTQNETLRAAYEEGRRLQEEGYAAQDAEKHAEAVDRFNRALALAETDEQRAALHILRGNSRVSLGQVGAAEGDYLAALDLALDFESETDRDGARAAALTDLGAVYGREGDLDKAEEYSQRALAIHEHIGNKLGQAADLANLGNVYADRGELDKAEEQYRKAAAIHEEIGNRPGQANQLSNLGNVYAQRGDLDKAEEYFEKALAIHEEIGNKAGQARQLGSLGNVRYSRGDLDGAEEQYEKALALAEEIGDEIDQARVLGCLGNIYAGRGDLDKAEEHYRSALAIDEEIGDRLDQAMHLSALGLLAEQRGEVDKARDLLTQAKSLYEAIGAGGPNVEMVREALERLGPP